MAFAAQMTAKLVAFYGLLDNSVVDFVAYMIDIPNSLSMGKKTSRHRRSLVVVYGYSNTIMPCRSFFLSSTGKNYSSDYLLYKSTKTHFLPLQNNGDSKNEFLKFSLVLGKDKIDISQFASWACWNKPIDIHDNSNLKFPCIVDDSFLGNVNANVIFVGLNMSRNEYNNSNYQWSNYHDENISRFDSRLRWAIQNTPELENAYMTDLIKGLNNSSSEYVKGYFMECQPTKMETTKGRGWNDKKQDKDNGIFVSLKVHADNFCKEMANLEQLQNKKEKIKLIFLGANIKKRFL